jgi:GrpB-like predicted nucleotidyltransferase (UPF0157 family)
MLLPIPVFVVDYSPEWPVFAARYVAEFRSFSPIVLDVHHIGSTSVPRLAAKPIIDLLPVVSNLAAFDKQQHCAEALGYVWHGEFGISGRRYCTLSDEAGIRLAQLHCFEVNSPHIVRYLAFRDYLRAHPHIAKSYGNEKHRAALLHPGNSHAYSEEKSKWIKNIERDAIAWYGNT